MDYLSKNYTLCITDLFITLIADPPPEGWPTCAIKICNFILHVAEKYTE